MSESYRSAGVSLEANDEAVDLIRHKISSAGATRPEVLGDIGGFSGAFRVAFERYRDPVIRATTDGVGTKSVFAQALKRYGTIGIDAVKMVVDDLVCDAAEPLFLLDYVSVGANVPARTAEIVGGVAEGCARAGCALLGGEISEHPGVMEEDEFDLAAFCVGVAERDRMLSPGNVHVGDAIVGLASSGLHSNGFSLVRKIVLDHDLDLGAHVDELGCELGEELLRPSRIHAPAVLAGIQAGGVRAAAHITGGGIAANVSRALPEGVGVRLRSDGWSRHPIFDYLQRMGGIPEAEMRSVFNMGLGMTLIVAPGEIEGVLEAVRTHGETASVVGEVSSEPGVLFG